MAIRAKQNALVKLIFYSFKRCVSHLTYHKVFLARVQVMKFKSIHAPVVSARNASATFVCYALHLELAPLLPSFLGNARQALFDNILTLPPGELMLVEIISSASIALVQYLSLIRIEIIVFVVRHDI